MAKKNNYVMILVPIGIIILLVLYFFGLKKINEGFQVTTQQQTTTAPTFASSEDRNLLKQYILNKLQEIYEGNVNSTAPHDIDTDLTTITSPSNNYYSTKHDDYLLSEDENYEHTIDKLTTAR